MTKPVNPLNGNKMDVVPNLPAIAAGEMVIHPLQEIQVEWIGKPCPVTRINFLPPKKAKHPGSDHTNLL